MVPLDLVESMVLVSGKLLAGVIGMAVSMAVIKAGYSWLASSMRS
jgi:hypothetical protein